MQISKFLLGAAFRYFSNVVATVYLILYLVLVTSHGTEGSIYSK